MTKVSAPEIVVGVDGSRLARHALKWALGEAVVRDATVRPTMAWAPPSMVARALTDGAEREAKELLDEAVAGALLTHTSAPPPAIAPAIQRGAAGHVLVDAAGAADLLVVGTRGAGGLSRLVLGSVSHYCAAHAPVPVAVVPWRAPLVSRSADVVVGVDRSRGSAAALRWAIEEAAARRSALTVVNAWWVNHPHAAKDFPFLDERAVAQSSQRLLHQMLDDAKGQARGWPPHVKLVPLEQSPTEGLLATARNASLLVLGSRGGGSATFFLGSVTEHCLRHSSCAVVVVPSARLHRKHASA